MSRLRVQHNKVTAEATVVLQLSQHVHFHNEGGGLTHERSDSFGLSDASFGKNCMVGQPLVPLGRVRTSGDEAGPLPALPQRGALTLRGRRMGAITRNV